MDGLFEGSRCSPGFGKKCSLTISIHFWWGLKTTLDHPAAHSNRIGSCFDPSLHAPPNQKNGRSIYALYLHMDTLAHQLNTRKAVHQARCPKGITPFGPL